MKPAAPCRASAHFFRPGLLATIASSAATLAVLAFLLMACQLNEATCDAECQAEWLDGALINDSSYADADSLRHRYRVSLRKGALSDADKQRPVIMAVHGFSASTFEWLEFRRFAGDTTADTSMGRPKALVSLVLLGGHGSDIDEFEASGWRDWGATLLEEYDSLVALGYANISIAGSSTACPLLLEYLDAGKFDAHPPRNIFFIDPIVVPGDKTLSLIGMVGPVLGNSKGDNTPEEAKHWYTNRPAADLDELYSLINRIKNKLEDGIRLPAGTNLKVWKGDKDPVADPLSALLIYKGLRTANGKRVEVKMVDTKKHVFTRLAGREPASQPGDAASLLQAQVFTEIISLASPSP